MVRLEYNCLAATGAALEEGVELSKSHGVVALKAVQLCNNELLDIKAQPLGGGAEGKHLANSRKQVAGRM